MSKLIHLYPNNKQYIIPKMVYGDGDIRYNAFFDEDEIWYDRFGTIHQFVEKYDDGTIGNYILAEINGEKINSIGKMIVSDLAEFGIKIVGDTIFQGGTIVLNLGSFLFKKYGKNYIINKFDGNKDDSVKYGYICIETGMVMYTGILHMDDGDNSVEFSFKISNDTPINIKYQISEGQDNWRQYTLKPDFYMYNYFHHGYKEGFIRIYTNGIGFKKYSIQAINSYKIGWNENKKVFELFCD